MDTICQMLSEVRKKNGEEYPGSTLSDIIVMLNVYMKKNEVDVNLLRHFPSCSHCFGYYYEI